MAKKKSLLAKKIIIAAAIILVLAIAAVLIAKPGIFGKHGNSNELIIYHWWTSPGEKAALDALINVFAAQHPNAIIAPTSVVSGQQGGGVATFQLVKELILSGDSPDAFQSHAGYETMEYVDDNLLQQVDDVWQDENLAAVTPKVIQVMSRFNGHYYSVPVDISRTNVIWYNRKLLEENGINPANLTTWKAFFSACDKLKAGGVKYPISMGTTWTASFAFDQIIASQGIGAAQDMLNGKITSQNDPRLVNSLDLFRKYLSYVNSNHNDLTWNEATDRVINGSSAFNIMGDWAEGEFEAANETYGKDYGTMVVPGTQGMYGVVIDTFNMPKHTRHPQMAREWLDTVASEAGQDAFNPLKGSISARSDTNASKYGPYQQSAISDFRNAKYIFPAMSNGAPSDFGNAESNAIGNFTSDLNVSYTAGAIADSAKKMSDEFTIQWQLD